MSKQKPHTDALDGWLEHMNSKFRKEAKLYDLIPTKVGLTVGGRLNLPVELQGEAESWLAFRGKASTQLLPRGFS